MSALTIDMDAGTVIEYQIQLHGVRIRWKSEITLWHPPHRFGDV